MVQQPNRDNEKQEDYKGDNKGHKRTDTFSAKVANIRVFGLSRSFLFKALQYFGVSTKITVAKYLLQCRK